MLEDGELHKTREEIEHLYTVMGMKKKDLNDLTRSGSRSKLEDRVNWTRVYSLFYGEYRLYRNINRLAAEMLCGFHVLLPAGGSRETRRCLIVQGEGRDSPGDARGRVRNAWFAEDRSYR
jgi:hypothetical protein